ncbi:MAG: winged helix-turn-helix transcriptional regulator [Chloroflexi bacterium]|nr:winged helix-turn-helix transcriptional regulator [Chloroflexota bacterium]
MAGFCGALADTTRLTILYALMDGSASVKELTEVTGRAQSAVSRHLAYLQRWGLAVPQRQAQSVYYSLNIDVRDVLRAVRECVGEGGEIVLD